MDPADGAVSGHGPAQLAAAGHRPLVRPDQDVKTG